MGIETRKILKRTFGRKQGPVTRLMSPSDFGEILKPFVFLDIFDYRGPKFVGPLHPHSGIATLTYLFEGRADLIDSDGNSVLLEDGGVEWMQAGHGMWHGGGLGDDTMGAVRGFQLWIALPPELELGPTESIFQSLKEVAKSDAVNVALGSYGGTKSSIQEPSPMNYLAVNLKKGEKWTYDPPAGHTVLWISAIDSGLVANNEVIGKGELIAFEHSEEPVNFTTQEDTQFILGSAVPHLHELYLGNYSVHTSLDALAAGEARIKQLAIEITQNRKLDKLSV